MLIFENIINIFSKAEQKMVAHYQTCCINSTEGTIHESIWKKPVASYSILAWSQKSWIVVRDYAHYRSNTNNKLTSFQKVLMVRNLSSYIQLLYVFLFCLDTNSSHAHDWQCAPTNCILKVGGRVRSTRQRDAPNAQALIQTHFNYLCRLYF